ncbi:MAG: diaminopimelate decarboxylase [Candidatus Gastranaerophilales bacterium]|nr:diaminopimelate decarboxylase [Candidatus Gastranaerophilales bacterium]
MAGTVNQSIMPLTAKVNENNHLEIGGLDTVELAEIYGTPLYVLDEEGIRTCCRQYKDAFSSYKNARILFASKAFMTKAMCCILKSEGIGLDVVSGGELYTALKSDFPMENIYFNGNNKSSEELELAIDSKIGRITVDNFLELALLDSVAKSKNVNIDILLRLTPGIECHTHEYIQTGHLDSKFGFDITQLDEAIELITQEYTNLNLKGLHAHIGSQIFETRIYHDLVGIILEQFAKIKDKFNITLEEMNLGGGLGVKYTDDDNPPSIYDIAKIILDSLNMNLEKYNLPAPKLIIEPGRSIICSSGVTLYTVGSSKQVPNGTKYVAVDGGMSDNPRPSMYQAKYNAVLANKVNDKITETVTIAGRFCESGDVLIKNIELPDIEPGDILCVFDTGAYNYSMSSNYNRVQKPAAILVHNGTSDVIIERESYENLVFLDRIPERLSC